MKMFNEVCVELEQSPKTWLITGVAGFIGSNLLEKLLLLNQTVTGLDNLETGFLHNLEQVRKKVSSDQWSRFSFIEGDIRNLNDCTMACQGVDYVLHQAALGSVPRSIKDPIRSNATNISGFLNMLVAARDAEVKSFTYAASSSTYGDSKSLPKVEHIIGKPLSPYAITKYVNELYADNFSSVYGFNTIGLRYFNVFGRRQNPDGAYAAVIPKFVLQLMQHESPTINGDGSYSRDFTYIDNVVQMNILAATTNSEAALNEVYNTAVGDRITIAEMLKLLIEYLAEFDAGIKAIEIMYGPIRAGDVPHSLASIEKAQRNLGYSPSHIFKDGLKEAVDWYWHNLKEL